MSIWNNRGFTENELSRPAKWLTGLTFSALLLEAAVSATQHAVRGLAARPWGFGVVLLGFALFLAPKVQVVRRVRLVSFGSQDMSVAQGNSYRVGYFLMATGFLLTFG
jgi:hypothetical protein